jgi:tetratricopeptide (TPR) repeat protein
LSHFGRDVDADALAQEMTFNGTAMWRVKDWLEQHDLIAKPFIANGGIAEKLLKNHLPFVLNVKSIYYYHSMAAVGVDETAGVLLVHDPSHIRMDKMLLSELEKREAPYGLEALAIVPVKDAHRLDLIDDIDSEPFSAYLQYQKVYQTQGPKKGRKIINDLKGRYPGHPFVLRMAAIDLHDSGRPVLAIQRQVTLLKRYPDCEHIRQELLNSLYRTGNKGLIRKVLAQIVLKKRLPGIRATQKWQYPPAEYMAQYAAQVGMVKSENATAVQMLWDAIEREPIHAGSYHALGDLHRQEGDFKKSILPYRCAATLELENHHYARGYLDALAKVGLFKEGIDFLKRRTEKLGGSVAGGQVWMTLIDAYEDYGYPDEAIDARSGSSC